MLTNLVIVVVVVVVVVMCMYVYACPCVFVGSCLALATQVLYTICWLREGGGSSSSRPLINRGQLPTIGRFILSESMQETHVCYIQGTF